MFSAIDKAKRALVTLLKSLAGIYGVALGHTRESTQVEVKAAYNKVLYVIFGHYLFASPLRKLVDSQERTQNSNQSKEGINEDKQRNKNTERRACLSHELVMLASLSRRLVYEQNMFEVECERGCNHQRCNREYAST